MKAITLTKVSSSTALEMESNYYNRRYLLASVEQSLHFNNGIAEYPLAHPLSTQFKGIQGCTLNPIIPDFTTQTLLDFDQFKL
jgi:hypothetical protein